MSRSGVDAATQVFVSYAVEDRATAERVVGALTSLGWQVWWDRELLPGKTFDERIADRLASAGAVVVLWSRHSVVSEWVREEASDAKRRDILIPAFIEQIEPPFGFKLRHTRAPTMQAGNRVREAYFDEQGHPTVIVGGYAVYSSEYDKRNREVRTSFLGTDGRLVPRDDGFAVVQREFDERGFVQGLTYLDAGGRPVKSVDGYAGARIKRNERGQLLEIAYHDEQGRPVVSVRPGSAKRRLTYDSLGKMIELSDFDAAGKPMTNAYEYSTMRYSYDEHGRETGRQVLDVAGRVLTFKVGIDKVAKGSVAADAGFRAGDVILAYDGEAVTTRYDFTDRLELFKGDRRREVRIERGTEIVGLDVPPGRIAGLTLEERVHP